jgi:ATP-dependent exoDNAse (exonuclease V) beta subunit
MTIHKAKGLEFKIVLFPFADVNIYYEKDASIWFPVTIPEIDLTMSRIRFNKELLMFGEEGEMLYENRRNMLELDNFNLLYVTLTRAVEQLYVFSEKPENSSSDKMTYYSDYFMAYMKELGIWDDGRLIYDFGNDEKKKSNPDPVDEIKAEMLDYLSHSPNEHGLKFFNSEAIIWDSEVEESLKFGNQIHQVMEQVISKNDIYQLKEKMRSKGLHSEMMLGFIFEIVDSIVSHPELSPSFSPSLNVINERDIITKNGEILRPDRLVFHSDRNVTIIDYKTGNPSNNHKQQINKYADAIQEMGYRVNEKILVYCSTEKIEINKV